VKQDNQRDRLFATTFFAGLALAMPAFAQQAEEPAAPAAEETDTIVVTGSRIPQANLVTTSPVTQITSDDITTAGVSRIEDLVNSLPQAFAAQNAASSNGATGTATVNLRGIGSDRTLVLIDGRRMGFGSPNDTAADLNQIPAALVERVDVLTGGASGVYGSDAVAGVVNFVMQDDFEGLRIDAQYSGYNHNNDYDGPGNIRTALANSAATNPSQFRIPDENVTDGYGKEITALLGTSTGDGRGNITAYITYRNNDAISQANRDYSACTVGISGANFACGGSSTNATGRFTSLDSGSNSTILSGQTFVPYVGSRDAYNFGPINYYQRPDERYSFGALGHYEFNEHVEVFTQLMFTDYSTVAQIAGSGAFYGGGNSANGGYNISCTNPLLTPAQLTTLGCTGAPGQTVEVLIGRRNVEGGGRQDDLGYQSFRGVVGARGALVEGWTYDLAAQYSKVVLSRTYLNDFSNTRIARALDVQIDPATGQPACVAAIDPDGPTNPLAAIDAACVPYNIWAQGGVTQAALNYVSIPAQQRGSTIQQVVTGALTGDLGTIGLKSPFAETAFQTAFGVEYRSDELIASSDTSFETGDLSGQGGPTQSVRGKTDVLDFFAELQLPLVEGKPFAELLQLDASYRYSDYSAGFTTDTYGVGGTWSPVSALRIRGSYQRAVRAPNVLELFTPQGLNLFDRDSDPCGTVPATATDPAIPPTATLAQCVATGVPAAQYGDEILTSPAGQWNTLQSGNPNLSPEEADTFTVGFVFAPSFIDGFNVSVDYFSIEVANLISTIDPNVTIDQCYVNNDAAACGRINRSNIGTLWTAGGYVEEFNTNIGGLKTTGVDVNANWDFGIGAAGALGLSFIGTYVSELEIDPGVGAAAIFDCVGFYGNQCTSGDRTLTPEWRHSFRVNWKTPYEGLELIGTWRHVGEVEFIGGGAARPDFTLDAQDYFDVAGYWQAKDNVRVRFGVNNVVDEDPPISASVGTTGNGNTFPQTYDAYGRYFFAGVQLDF
jgi:outer membrane receptor protein involved in Fe transport